MKSVKINFIYNSGLTVLSVIFPLITYPYVSRILGPVGLGTVNFFQSFSDFFVMIATLGIPLYGIREVAKNKDDQAKLNTVVSELLMLNIIFTVCSVIIYLISCYFVEDINSEPSLIAVFLVNVVFNVFSLDWMYKGLEEFKFITIRSLIFKIISLVILFFVVKSESDYVNYAILLVFSTASAYVVNILAAKKYVKINFNNLNIKKHLSGILITSVMFIVIRFYIGLDKLMIGFISGMEYVGYYSIPEKICRVLISIVVSLSAVLLPRMAYYHSNGLIKEFNNALDKSIQFIFIFSIPVVIGLFFVGDSIVTIFAGPEFNESSLTLKIYGLIVFFVGLANVLGLQLLYAIGQEKKYFISIIISMCTAIVCNFILIPLYKHNGAAIGTVLAEFVGVLIQILYCWNRIKNTILNFNFIKILTSNFIMILALIFVKFIFINKSLYFILFSEIIIGSLIYAASLIIIREQFVYDLIKKYNK